MYEAIWFLIGMGVGALCAVLGVLAHYLIRR